VSDCQTLLRHRVAAQVAVHAWTPIRVKWALVTVTPGHF
jgi:hypothetical protein